MAIDKALPNVKQEVKIPGVDEQLKTEVEDSIDIIESTNEFPENVSGLCDWGQYKFMCPAWQN